MRKHLVGSRVQHRVNVYDSRSRLRKGTVTRIYSYQSRGFGFYPELYEVSWDDGGTEHGFLRHGLTAMDAPC